MDATAQRSSMQPNSNTTPTLFNFWPPSARHKAIRERSSSPQLDPPTLSLASISSLSPSPSLITPEQLINGKFPKPTGTAKSTTDTRGTRSMSRMASTTKKTLTARPDPKTKKPSEEEAAWTLLADHNLPIGKEDDSASRDATLASVLTALTDTKKWTKTHKPEIMTIINAIIKILNKPEEKAEKPSTTKGPETVDVPTQVRNLNLEQMKQLLSESENRNREGLDRATQALEAATAEMRLQSDKIATRQSYSEAAKHWTPPPPTRPHPNPYQQRQNEGEPNFWDNQTGYQANPGYNQEDGNAGNQWPDSSRIKEREQNKAMQFVLDIGKEHALSLTSNTETLDQLNKALTEAGAPEGTKFKSVLKMARGGINMAADNLTTARWLREPLNSLAFRTGLGIAVDFTKRTFSLIAKFIPCQTFDPTNKDHVADLISDNGWEEGNLVRVRWARQIQYRKPNQAVAHLLIYLTDVNVTNRILQVDKQINLWQGKYMVEKDSKTPTRCARCQGWGHYAAECVHKEDTCAQCGKRGHRDGKETCSWANDARCVNCGGNHLTYSLSCPKYMEKVKELNARMPENLLPYYPVYKSGTQPNPTPDNAQQEELNLALTQI